MNKVVDAIPFGVVENLDDDLTLVTDSQDIEKIKQYFGNPDWWDFDGCFVKIEGGEYKQVYCFEGGIPYLDKPVYKITSKECPKGFNVEKGVCVSKPDERGKREVLLGFSLFMSDRFSEWSPITKDRLLDHLERYHASDFTDGNIDYIVRGGGWKGNEVYGDITLKVPELYWEDGDRDYFTDVGDAAIFDTVKYNLGRRTKETIQGWWVSPAL